MNFRDFFKRRLNLAHSHLVRSMLSAGILAMANTQAVATSYKVESMNGIHALGTSVVRAGTGADTFKAALFLASATISAATTAYSTTGELAATGNYTAGGVTFTWIAPTSSGTTAYSTPSASFTWANLTSSGSFDCVELYNSTQSNRTVAAYTFGAQSVTTSTFSLTMPTNAAGTALLQFA